MSFLRRQEPRNILIRIILVLVSRFRGNKPGSLPAQESRKEKDSLLN